MIQFPDEMLPFCTGVASSAQLEHGGKKIENWLWFQVKHLDRKTGEDVPKADVARYLQEKLHSQHSSSGSARLTASALTNSSSLLRLGSRHADIIRSNSTAHVEGGSDDEEDPRTRRRRR